MRGNFSFYLPKMVPRLSELSDWAGLTSLPSPSPSPPPTPTRRTDVTSSSSGLKESLLKTWLKAIYGMSEATQQWRVER